MCPSISSSSPSFTLQSTKPYSLEYPSDQLGSAVLAVASHNSLCTPASMLMGWGAEKTWTLCNPCSGVAKTSLCYQLFSAQILSTAPDQIPWRKFSLSQPKSAQFPGNLYLDSVKNLIRFTRSRALLITNKFLWDRAWSLCASPVPWLSLQYLCNSPQRQRVNKDN